MGGVWEGRAQRVGDDRLTKQGGPLGLQGKAPSTAAARGLPAGTAAAPWGLRLQGGGVGHHVARGRLVGEVEAHHVLDPGHALACVAGAAAGLLRPWRACAPRARQHGGTAGVRTAAWCDEERAAAMPAVSGSGTLGSSQQIQQLTAVAALAELLVAVHGRRHDAHGLGHAALLALQWASGAEQSQAAATSRKRTLPLVTRRSRLTPRQEPGWGHARAHHPGCHLSQPPACSGSPPRRTSCRGA